MAHCLQLKALFPNKLILGYMVVIIIIYEWYKSSYPCSLLQLYSWTFNYQLADLFFFYWRNKYNNINTNNIWSLIMTNSHKLDRVVRDYYIILKLSWLLSFEMFAIWNILHGVSPNRDSSTIFFFSLLEKSCVYSWGYFPSLCVLYTWVCFFFFCYTYLNGCDSL